MKHCACVFLGLDLSRQTRRNLAGKRINNVVVALFVFVVCLIQASVFESADAVAAVYVFLQR